VFLYQIFLMDNDILLGVLILFAYISALLLSMTFHEFAHAHAAKMEGDHTAKALGRYTLAPLAHVDIKGIIFLVLFGYGWAKPVPIDPRNFRNGKVSALKVYSAGVITNIIVGVVSAMLHALFTVVVPVVYTGTGYYGIALNYFLESMILLNFIFAFFNLLPFYSFDGYRIIETFTKPYNKFVDFMRKYSFMLLLLFVFTGIMSMYVSYIPVNLANLVIEGFKKLFGLFI